MGKKEAFIGLLPPNSERTVRLNLHNTSEEAFEFDTITRSCNCVTIRPTAGVIQPQGDFGLSVTVRSAAEEGEFTNTVFLVDSTTGATKPLKLRFRVLPLATVNDGVPIRICREGKENSTRFMIKSDYPGVLLDQYELAVTSEVLVNAVVTYRHDGMVLVVSDIKRDGLEPGVLTTTALVGFRKKNETAVDIPVIPLPIEITDAIRVFPSRILFRQSGDSTKSTIFLEGDGIVGQLENLVVDIVSEGGDLLGAARVERTVALPRNRVCVTIVCEDASNDREIGKYVRIRLKDREVARLEVLSLE